jgi:protoheme IX farnesyltransferase
MWMERQADSQMDRTKFRPLPSGLIKPLHALIFGTFLSIVGVGLVWKGANTLAGLLTLATVVSYLLFYTPLKTKTTWCTLVGSLPGAIPPIIGTATKLGTIDTMGWWLFALLFFWQVPHFMSLAVMCRHDYERGGFKIATVADPTGRSAALWSISFMIPMLFVVSAIAQTFFAPDCTSTLRGWMSPFIWVSLIASIIFLKLSLDFMLPHRRNEVAKPFFLASILYLPVILLTLTLNRLF